jgi:FlaA1/EpsC-like NDP-sugar epimerase
MWGGEIFVPKIPSYRILDLAEAVAPGCRLEVVGIRLGEKLHEELITEMDALSAMEFDGHYAILPSGGSWFRDVREYAAAFGGRPCPPGFKYRSDTNADWLGVDQLREQIRSTVDPAFRVP